MFVGQATAVDIKIDIPTAIKSMSTRLFSHKTDFLSFKVISDLLAVVNAENNNVHANLMEIYSFNWWDGSNVGGFTILLY